MAARPILSAVSIIVLAGGVLFQFFVILSGVINDSAPFNRVYFLQADTSGISGGGNNFVPNPARWTYFAACGVRDGRNANCGKVNAAMPFDPVRNFGTQNNVPEGLVQHPSQYYYMSRVMWAFYIIALFFAVVALLLGVFALCSRLAAKFTGLVTIIALVMQAVTAALMTYVYQRLTKLISLANMVRRAWTVKGRAAFRSNNQDAKLGTYAYAFTWSAFACFLISTVLFCVGGGKDKSESSSGGYFGRKRSTRSRGSFRDSESGRRVKDEYD